MLALSAARAHWPQRRVVAGRRISGGGAGAGACYYEVLGVAPDASRVEAKRAYVRLAKEHHPDASPADPARSAARFRAVAEAWETVGDADKRAAFDERRRRRAFEPRGGQGPTAAPFGRASHALERALGPRVVGAAFLVLAGAVLLGFTGTGGKRPTAAADDAIEECWVNPRTKRLEPPAPWDASYEAARKAGATRTARRSELR